MASENSAELACKALLQNSKTMMLSTVAAEYWQSIVENDSQTKWQRLTPQTESSLTPFVMHNERFYIFVSELAKHTANLQAMVAYNAASTECSEALLSVLLANDEAKTEQLFARTRLSMQCRVSEIAAKSALYQSVLSQFTEEFGEVVDILKTLDFHLFELESVSGSYVQGFGQAFQFNGLPCLKMQLKNK